MSTQRHVLYWRGPYDIKYFRFSSAFIEILVRISSMGREATAVP
jgi:hypothetical protein